MSKREQALRIEPKNEVHFKGPYTRVVTEYFHLSNPTEKPIAFKVKTTAPKRYCVRPNNGTIAPGKSVNVAVMLQPLAGGDQAAAAAAIEKNKHKFMIQSVFVATENGNADDLFKSVSSDEIMDSKFRCVFDDTASGNTGAASAANNRSESDNEERDLAEVGGGSGHAVSKGGNFSLASNIDHDDQISSSAFSAATTLTSSLMSTSAASTVVSADSSHMTNGGDDDHHNITTSHAPSRYQAAVATSGGDTTEVKRLLDENRDLRVKLQEFERVAKSAGGAGAFNRFAGAGSSSTGSAAASSSSSQQKSTSTVSSASANLLDQPLSGQVILTVLISLLIGFILGKVDLGLF